MRQAGGGEERPQGGDRQVLPRREPLAIRWLRAYQSRWWRPDLYAGLTLWGMLAPEAIAYAGMAGAPPQAGLYTLVASLAAHFVLGASRQLVCAATSSSVLLRR